MDRFYDRQTSNMPTKDLQLTAVTSLFIASKNLEVDPLDLLSSLLAAAREVRSGPVWLFPRLSRAVAVKVPRLGLSL